MSQLQHIHMYQLMFLAYCICHLHFVHSKWEWISRALTESNTPSALRLSGFMLVNVICVCEVFYTFHSAIFHYKHMIVLALFAGGLYGIIKAAQILAFKNGGTGEEKPASGMPVFEKPPLPPPITENITNETKAE